VATALTGLPEGRGIVVTHGGPIASLLGQERGLAPRDWLSLVPPVGARVVLASQEDI
jgi:broad specificity phosphatase PhoE